MQYVITVNNRQVVVCAHTHDSILLVLQRFHDCLRLAPIGDLSETRSHQQVEV